VQVNRGRRGRLLPRRGVAWRPALAATKRHGACVHPRLRNVADAVR